MTGPGALLDDYPLWHPMTDMPSFWDSPLTMRAGRGSRLWDVDGNEYVSANAGLWNVSLGYDHPAVSAAIRYQLEQLAYGTLFRFGNEPAQRLAQRLVGLVGRPGLTRVFLTSSGSSAVDTALKLVRRHHRLTGSPSRRTVAAFTSSYHGTMYGAMALTGEDLDQDEYLVDRRDVLHIATPDRSRCAACRAGGTGCHGACWSAALEVLERRADELAAVMIEPILGSAGVVVPPDGFLSALSRFCRARGILLVVDEVATGFGRTGRMFAVDGTDLAPDLVIVSKAINNGALPLAAVVVAEEIWRAFIDRGAVFAHGETQSGNPLACAAALATLDVVEQDDLAHRSRRVGAQLADACSAILDDTVGGHVEGAGLMLGLHLDAASGTPTPGQVLAIVGALLRRGVVVHPSPLGVSLLPPLTIEEPELQTITDALHDVLRRTVLQ